MLVRLPNFTAVVTDLLHQELIALKLKPFFLNMHSHEGTISFNVPHD